MTSNESKDVTGSSSVATGDGGDTRRRIPTERVADVVITALLLVLFGWAYLETGEWSFRAALFPRLVTGVAFVLSAVHLVLVLRRLRPGSADAPAEPEPPAEDDADRDDVEYVFGTASGRAWAEALAWIAGFFVTLYVAGLFLTAPVFSVLYLRFAGGRTWKVSVIYAVVVGVVLYVAFEVLLGVPTPEGLILD